MVKVGKIWKPDWKEEDVLCEGGSVGTGGSDEG